MTTTIGIVTIALAVVLALGFFSNLYRVIEAGDQPPKPRPVGKARARGVLIFVAANIFTISVMAAAGITLLRVG
jgi:hypothetical protein